METGSVADLYVPDFVNTLAQADQAAAFAKDQQRQNALASFMSQSGDALMQGDTNALAQFARLDPMAAMQIQQRQQEQQWRADDRDYSRQQDAIANQRADRQFAATEARQAKMDGRADEEWRMKLDAHMRGLKADELAAQTAEMEGVLSGAAWFYQSGDQAGYDQFLQSKGIDPAQYPFAQFPAHAAQFKPVLDAMKGFKPEAPTQIWRAATGQEAGAYGAQAGQINTQTGEFKRTPVDSGLSIETGPDGTRIVQGAGAADKIPKLTESEGRNTGFLIRAQESGAILDSLEAEGTNLGDRLASNVPILGNYMVSDEYQKFAQAKRDFVNALLRRESGAVISPEEFDNADKQYFPQPGDSKEVIAQKRANRASAIAGLRVGSGKGATLPEASTAATAAPSPAEAPAQPARRRWTPDGGLQ